MGKYIARPDGNKQVLYKKSNVTCNTYSRTCSETNSQFIKRAVTKMKRNASKSNMYYTDGNAIKRDLSVETDHCIVRRYLKHKRNKFSAQGESSVKSKPSICLDIEDDGDKFKPDTTASGDFKDKYETYDKNNIVTVDITTLMLENLRNLLHDWISKHVLEDNETKLKLIQVLNSIIYNLGNKVSETPSSCSTYILDRNGGGFKVRNRKTATNPLTTQYFKRRQTSLIVDKSSSIFYRKYSRFTIPVSHKHLRIISTLSIPRNMHKHIEIKKSKLKTKESHINNKTKAPVTDKKNSNSSTNLYNYKLSRPNNNRNRPYYKQSKRSNQRGVIILPGIFYDSTTDGRTESENDVGEEIVNIQTDNINIEPNQSLLKSIYQNNPGNMINTNQIIEHENKNNNFTMNKVNHVNEVNKVNNVIEVNKVNILHTTCSLSNKKSFQLFKDDTIQEKHTTSSKRKQREVLNTHGKYHTKRIRKYGGTRTKSKHLYCRAKGTRNHKKRQLKYDNIKYRKFNYLYRKTNCNIHSREFLDHMRNILRYFTQCKRKRNIKLEIHVDVYPSIEVEEEKKLEGDISGVINESSKCFEINDCQTNYLKADPTLPDGILESDINPDEATAKFTPEIIPILDGATSQAKIFRCNNTTSVQCKSENTVLEHINECGTIMTGLEVCKEICDLKCVLRDLSATTEKIVTEHLRRKRNKTGAELSSVATVVPLVETTGNRKETLKGIQLSNISPKNQLMSGIKLSKEPKRVEEFTNRLKKRSSSYHVIESESILRVTDMTSLVKSKTLVNKSCSPPKSKSLLDVTKRINKQRLLTFFNDEHKKNSKRCHSPSKRIKRKNSKSKSLSRKSSPNCKQRFGEKIVLPLQMQNCQSSSEHEFRCKLPSYSSVCLEIDKPTITVKCKDRLTFLEGCVYCIVLWIPLIVLMYFFYDYVLKDLLKSSKNTTDPKGRFRVSPVETASENSKNVSQFLLKLSDFGF